MRGSASPPADGRSLHGQTTGSSRQSGLDQSLATRGTVKRSSRDVSPESRIHGRPHPAVLADGKSSSNHGEGHGRMKVPSGTRRAEIIRPDDPRQVMTLLPRRETRTPVVTTETDDDPRGERWWPRRGPDHRRRQPAGRRNLVIGKPSNLRRWAASHLGLGDRRKGAADGPEHGRHGHRLRADDRLPSEVGSSE
jgi:hypothetical protein